MEIVCPWWAGVTCVRVSEPVYAPPVLTLASRLLLGPLLLVAFNAVGAVLAAPGRPFRRVLPFVASLVGAVALFLLPPPLPVLVAFPGLLAFGFAMRMLDAVTRAEPGVFNRLALVLIVFDTRNIRPCPPRLDARSLARGVGLGAMAIAALLAAANTVGFARTIAGMFFFYGLVGGGDALAHTVFAAIGLHLPAMQRAPIRSRSVTEFWGRRWNREVGDWLERWCFRPLSRRGHRVLGVVAAFTFSAVLHAVPTWAAAGFGLAIPMFAFFLVHGAVVLVEGALRVPRWPPVAGHVWTVGVFVVTAPLFVRPGLALFGLT